MLEQHITHTHKQTKKRIKLLQSSYQICNRFNEVIRAAVARYHRYALIRKHTHTYYVYNSLITFPLNYHSDDDYCYYYDRLLLFSSLCHFACFYGLYYSSIFFHVQSKTFSCVFCWARHDSHKIISFFVLQLRCFLLCWGIKIKTAIIGLLETIILIANYSVCCLFACKIVHTHTHTKNVFNQFKHRDQRYATLPTIAKENIKNRFFLVSSSYQ